MKARKQYFDLLRQLVNEHSLMADGGTTTFLREVDLEFDTSFTFNITSVGFSKQKWRNLVYSYIEPRSFHRFVKASSKAKLHKPVGYTCPVYSLHKGGNCILGWVYNGHTLTAHSRVCLWAPTGALDMAMLTQVARLIKAKRIRWLIGCVKISVMKGLPSVLAMGVFPDSPFVSRNKSKIAQGDQYGAKRAEKLRRCGSADTDGELPPIDFYMEFLSPHVEGGDITPESLAKLAGVKSVKIRNYLRDEELFKKWGYAQFYVGENHYVWKTYSDPMVKAIMSKFNIPLPR